MIRLRIPRSVMRVFLVTVMLAVLAAVACSGDDADPTATAPSTTAAPPATSVPATTVAPATESLEMTAAVLQLHNIADTVERVRPTVVSIVA